MYENVSNKKKADWSQTWNYLCSASGMQTNMSSSSLCLLLDRQIARELVQISADPGGISQPAMAHNTQGIERRSVDYFCTKDLRVRVAAQDCQYSDLET